MSKYKVGDELVIIENPSEDNKILNKNSFLSVEDNFSTFSWAIKIVNVEYNEPEVVLTYKNAKDEIHKVFAICKDVTNFDKDKVLEKALLKAYLQELVTLSTLRDYNLTKL